MTTRSIRHLGTSLLLCSVLLPGMLRAATLPARDERAKAPATLNTLRTFPEITRTQEWTLRAREIREHVLVSCGLAPMPEKTPLNAKVFDKVERDGYSIEKVYFQTYPGFYLAGNLYRPLGRQGPFPAILNPHGHWANGRMADNQDGSIAARCINFAKQGMIAFTYDMVGYNDTTQVTHKFGGGPTNELWNISLMGLQTWNSVRALDFLESLPDVDRTRLACTGESGGGTQTFMLGAIEDRLAAQAPIVMVSHSMQGGCLCENAPGLRVNYSNMELAAQPAPRPQMFVAATGDWTKTTLTIEGPSVKKIYELLHQPDNLNYAIFNYNHNYNKTSREAVYQWAGKVLLHDPKAGSIQEAAYTKEPDAALRVFPDGKLPADALDEARFTEQLKSLYRSQFDSLLPSDRDGVRRFKTNIQTVWRHSLQLDYPVARVISETLKTNAVPGATATYYAVGRPGRGDRLPVILFQSATSKKKRVTILAHPEGKSVFLNASGDPVGLAKSLLDAGQNVLVADLFLTGELANPEISKARDHHTNFFSTYNHTDTQERVQDLITLCSFVRSLDRTTRVIINGAGRAGLWALLAAPAANAVAADEDTLDLASDAALLAPDLFSPGLRKFGAFTGGALLAVPNPLLVHNAHPSFPVATLKKTYDSLRLPAKFRGEASRLDNDQLVAWISSLEL